MKIYKKDKYRVSNKIHLENSCIVDERIDQIYKIDDPEEYEIIQNVFSERCIETVLTNHTDQEQIKQILVMLSDLDLIQFKGFFRQKNFCDTLIGMNILNLFLDLFFRYFILYIPIAVCLGINRYSLTKICFYFITLIISFILHECFHLFMYLALEGQKKYFFSVSWMHVQLITPVVPPVKAIMVSLAGPVFTSVIAMLVFYASSQAIFMWLALYNLSMILPFFDDGKNIWQQIKICRSSTPAE